MLLSGAGAGSRNQSWSRLDRLHNSDGYQKQCCGAATFLGGSGTGSPRLSFFAFQKDAAGAALKNAAPAIGSGL